MIRDTILSMVETSVQTDEIIIQKLFVKKFDMYDLIEDISIFPKVIFHQRNSNKTFFAFGCAKNFSSLEKTVSFETEIPKWTVLAFDPEKEGWDKFPNRNHWIAEVTCIVEENCDKTLTVEIFYTPKQIVSQAQEKTLPPLYKFDHAPNREVWIQNIIDSKKLCKNNTIEKIVLARCSRRKIHQPHHRILQSLSLYQKNCYHFFYSPAPNYAFFGISPERLFCITKNTLHTEALAGTRPRNADSIKDAEQAIDLLQHPKDTEEHNIVVEYVQKTLSRFSSSINITNKELLQLPYVQHIRTNISAELHENFDIDDLIHTLHPTPAVCGTPKNTAYIILRDIEKIPRGWYAGSFGLIQDKTIDCTVMIRSSLCIDNEMYVWTGAGIVESSDPKMEWEELDNKATQFFQISEEPLS